MSNENKLKNTRKLHPWRTGPSVQKHLTESRQVERTHRNAQKTWTLVRPKKR